STGRPEAGLMTLAILRAVMLLVGRIAPTALGISIQVLKNFSSSSNRSARDLRRLPAISMSPPEQKMSQGVPYAQGYPLGTLCADFYRPIVPSVTLAFRSPPSARKQRPKEIEPLAGL